MWNRNIDTGKWYNQNDTLSKNDYDSLKQDLNKVKLYSKCLSGSTYLPIDNFDDIYDTLNIKKIGYYINQPNSNIHVPINGPSLPLNASNSNEFYNKYLKEDAFTIKNLFTPNKLIDSQLLNFLEVDVATTEEINIDSTLNSLIIDGVKIIDGHRILIKDQVTEVTLSKSIDPEEYFLDTELVSNYYEVQDNVTSVTYNFYNNRNGIYKYTNNKLVKTDDLERYDLSFEYSVNIKMGDVNREKQYHLLRLKNGYYPTTSENQNLQFSEKHNWVLRNRVDYNNIYDLNYYDILHHSNQDVYENIENKTYSITSRTIAVGEFGVIINNQDLLYSTASHFQSHIILNKYKVDLLSICQVSDYYWVCGKEGTLLKISKYNLNIEKIDIGELSDLTSISFFGDLNGMVVGKFNTIYWTKDGGYNWTKISYPEFDIYSYNKVIQSDFNIAYVGGESGVFMEFVNSGGSWLAYKRKVSKKLNDIDEYILVEDINDMFKTNWTVLSSYTYSKDQSINDFSSNLIYINTNSNTNELNISINTPYSSNSTFSSSEFFISINITDSNNNTVYSNPMYGTALSLPSWQSYNFYNFTGLVPSGTVTSVQSTTISLPLDANGNLTNTTYHVNIELYYNYDAVSDSILPGFVMSTNTYNLKTKNGNVLLISTNNDNVILYDIDDTISSNKFIYHQSTQSHSDIKTIIRSEQSDYVYIGGDKIYKFHFTDFLNSGTSSNISVGQSYEVSDIYVNKFYTTYNYLYVAGNNSLTKSNNYSNNLFYDIDPTLNDGIKSRFLFLDYDIASKLNFFTDDGEYRLTDSITFSISSITTSTINIKNIEGEYNWINYYKDSEKTFKYYSSISDSNKVEFSTTFSYTSGTTSYTFIGSQVSISSDDILPLAPNITSLTASRFIEDSTSISSRYGTLYDVLLNKYLIILKTDTIVDVGDVIRITSNVIDCNLVVNRIERYVGDIYDPSILPVRQMTWPVLLTNNQYVDTYIYCYSDFNENIIKNIKKSTLPITVTNLNKFNTLDSLLNNFEYHPISIGYKMDSDGVNITVDQRFNNKTAYYNMQSNVTVGTQSKLMKYKDSFLNFGYGPTYNILDYLTKIDSNLFTHSSIYSILPEYFSLNGNDGDTFTNSNIYIDVSTGQQAGTPSWYKDGTNKIIFGSDYKFNWESLLINTFVDIKMNSTIYGDVTVERLLITKKYYDSSINGYTMEFHKKIEIPTYIPVNNFYVNSFDIKSRNTLGKISEDLQLLNNIQRVSTDRSIQYLNSFSSLENELKYKFPTDSYFKALVSDFNIREQISAIIYTDSEYQIAMNIINVEKEIEYNINNTYPQSTNGFTNKLALSISEVNNLKVGDLIFVQFTGGTGSSEELNPQYSGLQTVLFSYSSPTSNYVVTSKDYGSTSLVQDYGKITFIKKDPFFNYQPIDIFNIGTDHNITRSVEINSENVKLVKNSYKLTDIDLSKYKIQFIDGLSLDEVSKKFSWLLEAEISDAIIGRDSNGIIWYSGTWKCGRWFGGTWLSGKWINGDWYGGTWNSIQVNFKNINNQIDKSAVNNSLSKWYNGRWFDGTWNGGTWYNGRRYDGTWRQGMWYNGIWNNGTWNTGIFEGGVWVQGKWESGIFNCNSKPSYWIDGQFKSGDFENGIWYNGQFGNENNILSRFGTKSTNSRTSNWHGGKWINGEFHSYLNIDDITMLPTVSDIHKYSIWRTGTWLKGDFYGGIAFNIDFKSGNWHGGILEEIQICGVDSILPSTQSNNAIVLNGIFKFNIGDEIWIIDDYTNGAFSPIGNNDRPMSYRINKVVEDTISERTKLYLNYNLSILGVTSSIASMTYSDVETGLRVVSHFKDSNWRSGLWTNGIFEGGQFDSGIWYNGIFNGTWGN